jgi:type II secretory pathway pseudopilin PulG
MKTRRRAMTFAELLMAMIVTLIIALAVATVFRALSSAHAQSESCYGAIQTARHAMRRIQLNLQKAQLITAIGIDNRRLLCWMGDENEDKEINLSELVLLSYVTETDEMVERQVVFPDTMEQATRDALDEPFTLQEATNLSSMAPRIRNDAYCRTLLLGADVREGWFSAEPGPPLSTLVSVRITVGEGGQSLTLRSAARLRADMTRHVGTAGGDWVLSLP